MVEFQMLHLQIQTNSDNITEIDVDPHDAVISILNFIENPMKNWQTNSKVYFIYNKFVLSHYLSFTFQEIKNNSKISVIVADQSLKTNRFISIADQNRQKFIKYDRTNKNLDCELQRLSDLSFLQLESSYYSNLYSIQKLLESQEQNQATLNNKNENNNAFRQVLIKKTIPFKQDLPPISKEKSISEEPLPRCFNFSYL